ncbi:MAG: hypothetical protein HeimC2_23610 [Candidatus Heimdallarchaeota archaeon LC_2]|nr:MAG: hypothetical protein HeimC2_23610 [Candidatus Heimdallarchaeota archaeon LC_2]
MIYVTLKKNIDKTLRLEVLLKLASYILDALYVTNMKIEGFMNYPSKSSGELVREIQIGQFHESISTLYHTEIIESDYIKIVGQTDIYPFQAVLTLNPKEFEHTDFYFNIVSNQEINWSLIFTHPFRDFFDGFHEILDPRYCLNAFISDNIEVLEYWDYAWALWFSEKNDFIKGLIKFIGRIKDVTIFPWLTMSERQFKHISEALKFIKPNVITEAFIEKTNDEFDVTPLGAFNQMENYLEKASVAEGSIAIYGNSSNNNSVTYALNDLISTLAHALQTGFNAELLIADIAEHAVRKFNQLKDRKELLGF